MTHRTDQCTNKLNWLLLTLQRYSSILNSLWMSEFLTHCLQGPHRLGTHQSEQTKRVGTVQGAVFAPSEFKYLGSLDDNKRVQMRQRVSGEIQRGEERAEPQDRAVQSPHRHPSFMIPSLGYRPNDLSLGRAWATRRTNCQFIARLTQNQFLQTIVNSNDSAAD